MPEKETAIDVLAASITRLHQSPFKPSLSQASDDFFEFLAPEMPFANKMAFSNMWLFKRVVFNQLGKSNAGNALMRTTISPTIFNSGIKDNVIPTTAKAVVNFRILPGTTSKDVIEHVTKAINDQRVEIRRTEFAFEPTPVTSTQHPSFQLLMSSIRQTFPNTIVAPYLCIGATDARSFTHISEATLRFVPFTDLEGYHGIDERISITQFNDAMNFYHHFLGNL
jgi:carboxypeptidase PM20D1